MSRDKNLILKSLLLPLLLLLTVLPVQAEEKSWYEIDGIKFRTGLQWSSMYFRSPSRSESDDEGYLFREQSGEGLTNLFPVSIVFPESLINSFSFRGAYLFYHKPVGAKDLIPGHHGDPQNTGNYRRQNSDDREWLINNFFNSEDKEFIDGKSKWALSGEWAMEQLALGYYFGLFIPIGKYHRFLKIGLGFSAVLTKAELTVFLCEEFEKISRDYQCNGKKEIDSASKTTIVTSPLLHLTVWERYSESSIFQIFSYSGNNSSSPLNLEYKKHSGSLNERVVNTHLELFSYTYRF